MDYFAWTAIGRLSVHGKDKPSFAACKECAIENQPWMMNRSGKGTRAVQVGGLPPLRAQRMRLETLGRVELDPVKVKRLCLEAFEPPRAPPPIPMSVLQWWDEPLFPNAPDATIAAPSPALPLTRLVA
jgi:hypothetical protein